MFKYTPPWQVLCNSLDHHFKRQTSTVKDSPCDACIHPPDEEQAVIHSHHSHRLLYPNPAQTNPSPTVPMTSSPKRWVIKPFTPKLEKSDLRSMLSPTGQSQSPDPWSNSQKETLKFDFESVSVTGMQPTVMVSYRSDESDVVVQARQVSVSEDGSDSEDWRPSNPSSPGTLSSTGSHVGFYSFVDDPASPEAEMNETYMLSPERQAKLNTLKEKNTFRLQTYMEEKRPGRLFEETNGDDERYRVEDASEGNKVEDSPDRTEIIRNQAPKKGHPALKEQWSALENLDLSSTPQSLLDGFSLRYSYTPVSPKPKDINVEPGSIDNEQIDFNSARKQFLLMEQKEQKPFPLSPQQFPYSLKLRGRTLSPMASIFPSKKVSPESTLRENRIPLRTQLDSELKNVTVDLEDGVPSGAIEDFDSGLSDQSAGFGSDGSISNNPSGTQIGSNLSTYIAGETPIEREIRINQEREENLRRSRGILRSDSSEMIEIRTKSILTHQQIRPAKTKDANRVSFLIQRELELEKRQQNQNKVFSLYNQEHQPEVKEKRKTFEPQPDEGSITSFRTNSRESPTNVLQDIAEEPAQKEKGDFSEEVLSPCCPHRHPDESTLMRSNTEGRTFDNQDGKYPAENVHSKGRVYKENTFETQSSSLRTKTEPFWIAENGLSRRNRLSLNFPSQPEPTKTSRYAPTWRSTSWSPQMENAPKSIRQEIEEDFKREQELQELRESSSKSFSTNRDLNNSTPMNLELTSTEHRYSSTTSEETVFLPQTSQKNLTEVDSLLSEKPKTDDGYLSSRLSMPDKGQQLSSSWLTSRLPSLSIMTPQPWGSTNPMSPTVSRVTPINPSDLPADVSSPLSQKGLTETLLKDFEDRRVKLKLEESAYAGIQPIDDINNEVVEATRVTRHKNQRALQWEAGMYANQDA